MYNPKEAPDFKKYICHPSGAIINSKTGHQLKPCNTAGYQIITLSDKGRQKRWYVHRLIATIFLENPLNLPQINHKNGIKSDNRVENLEWCTSKENIKHAWETGLSSRHHPRVNSKLTNSQIVEIRSMRGFKQKEIAALYKVAANTIHYIIKRKTWNHI